ncbi:hypothetical protein H7H82_17905 [Mycobacterium heidelbergense]|nr:hypothetical protein [Mycobacterium heidelbergense]MCV7052444.1 hypothetical protein [Mycobacterium heidelbergense]
MPGLPVEYRVGVIKQNSLFDMRTIRRGKIDDEGLRFAKRPVAVAV